MSDAEKSALAAQVRQDFLHAWEGYRRHAWGHDEVRPISGKPHDWYDVSLLMTPIDALDTMILMGLKPQADEARGLIATKLNLDQDIYVKDFEITIRLLGALLSNYQLSGDKRLLALADDLGRRMLPMFNSPTGMPYEYVNLKTGAVRGKTSNPAEIGTLLLEYGTLSKLTGKPVYYEKAKRAVVELYKRRSPLGLVGSSIDVETGKWGDPTAGIMGGIDSYYEYLLKARCSSTTKTACGCGKRVMQRLTSISPTAAGRPMVRVGRHEHREANKTYYGALYAFFPAVLVLSGDVDRAARLQQSSYNMWNLQASNRTNWITRS